MSPRQNLRKFRPHFLIPSYACLSCDSGPRPTLSLTSKSSQSLVYRLIFFFSFLLPRSDQREKQGFLRMRFGIHCFYTFDLTANIIFSPLFQNLTLGTNMKAGNISHLTVQRGVNSIRCWRHLTGSQNMIHWEVVSLLLAYKAESPQ